MAESLLGQLSRATGLPQDLVQKELERLIGKAGKNPSLELEELRDILAEYLQEVLLQAQSEFSETEKGAVLPFRAPKTAP
jgi:hypothetical protein